MKRINRVIEVTVSILEYSDVEVKQTIYDFLRSISEINILKLGTTVGNDLVAERLFNDNQDIIMKFLITSINILNEDKNFFTKENSYINTIHSITDVNGLFGNDYIKLIPTIPDKLELFNELISLYIMGAIPTRVSIFGGE